DLNPQSTGGSGTAKYNSSAEQCIIQFDEFTHWNGAGPFTFQIVLSPDGSFAFNYLNIGSGDFSTTIGIQNANASDALQLAYNQNFASDNLTIKFSTAKQWVQVEPQNGIVASGASATIEYSVNSVSLSDGNYNALLLLGTNDPENPLFQIPVTLSVNGNCAGWQLGDPTNDSTINVLDVVMVIGFALNQEEPNLCQIYASDLNSDENINVLDVIQIVGEILGD
ncbi:MAG: dockerin type I repeat-containing protein, partial [Candidatus Marinimicrobia bacterium]|nr:dockerin type I repeat-containing protein [Candidatus Neomarinimicrobiota bacterium]